MVESSWPWDGTTLGDATTAPYSSSEYAQFVRTVLDDNGVAPNARFHMPVTAFNYSNLLVTGTATPVTINAGYAWISGYTYISDANTTMAVSTPGANPRIDRLILRISWAAQTIRQVLLAGVEAATPSPPALTQTIGTTYEVSLAQIFITTGGVITVRDERPGYMGIGPGVFFRDIRDRVFEEFFDHMNSMTGASVAPVGWTTALVGTGATSNTITPPSATSIATGATNPSSVSLFRAYSSVFATELAQAPLLFEARMQIATATGAADAILMRLIDSAGTSYIEYGMKGSVSTANLMIRDAAGGAATSFTTGQAVDTAAYHTYGIYVPASGGPAVAFYDGIAIGQIAGNIPASGTDMRAEFRVEGTGTNRALNIDWARLVRGTA